MASGLVTHAPLLIAVIIVSCWGFMINFGAYWTADWAYTIFQTLPVVRMFFDETTPTNQIIDVEVNACAVLGQSMAECFPANVSE